MTGERSDAEDIGDSGHEVVRHRGSTIRMRRARERRAEGTVRVEFEIYAGGTDLLVDLGWLAAGGRQDRRAVQAAVMALVEAAIAVELSPARNV